MAEMNTAWTAASEEIYKAQQAAGAQGADAGSADAGNAGAQANNSGSNVEDAQFEEVK
jgi:molecular chaperone DnaK